MRASPKGIPQFPAELQIGKRYGRLTVVSISGINNSGAKMLLCICDCGNKKIATVSNLKHQHVTSCGCGRREITAKRSLKHGLCYTPEYRCWAEIKKRCYNQNHKFYSHYGARGISMCDRWRYSFESFLSDMGPKPPSMDSIDRRDNDKGYSPDNCRWATITEQQNNKRSNRVLEFKGKRMTLAQWGRHLNVPRERLNRRLNAGYTVEQILTQKIYERRGLK